MQWNASRYSWPQSLHLTQAKPLDRRSPDTGKSPVYDMVARTHIAVRNVHLKGQTNRQVVTPAYFEK
jgi:hypothetical protein